MITGRSTRPISSQKLGLTASERVAHGIKSALRELERSGEIARIRKNRYVLPAEADLVTGHIVRFIRLDTDF